MAFNDVDLIRAAALAGQGLGYLFADPIDDHCRAGRLMRVLNEWTITIAGFFL